MSFVRLLALLALLMLALPAQLKASCCPQQPIDSSEQMPDVPPCHGQADDPAPPTGDDCDGGDCCACRTPAALPLMCEFTPTQPFAWAFADELSPLLSPLYIPLQPPPIV
jgi:hypothetical protein